MFHNCKRSIRISFYLHRNPFLKMSQLESLKFDNLSLRRLPIDPNKVNHVRRVEGACFSRISPTPVDSPELVAHSPSALALLDLELNETNSEEFVEYFSGNKTLPGSETAAHCYCGHQFGNFAGQLGDGAVVYLGEVINSKNERWEIQLKGAGLTPFSRNADGRKVLRSSIREFLCSEAMHFLGIPTSRAGTCITSLTTVTRDIHYNGHPIEERCSIVLRIAPTFIRFGSFEIFNPMNLATGRSGPSFGRIDILHTMLDYVIETYYPEIHSLQQSQVEKYEEFFKEVVLRTARLVAQWQSVGFCHGVLNTDNMSILGLTIDYGPFGFLDMYNPHHICNGSDVSGRYSFNAQPEICKWNLRKFAEAIQQALPLTTSLGILQLFDEEFERTYLNKMRAKLGLIGTVSLEDKKLIDDLFETMEKTGADFTNTFLALMFFETSVSDEQQKNFDKVKSLLVNICYSPEVLLRYYRPDFLPGQLQTFKHVTAANSEIVNQPGPEGNAIRKVIIQIRKTERLEILTEETKQMKDHELWDSWLIKYRSRIRLDIISFEGNTMAYKEERERVMKSTNPRLILRNYIAQEAIDAAENGDFSHVQRLIKSFEDPYSFIPKNVKHWINHEHQLNSDWININRGIFDHPPDSAFSIKVT